MTERTKEVVKEIFKEIEDKLLQEFKLISPLSENELEYNVNEFLKEIKQKYMEG